ncbi:MAG: hypothetical protein LAO31_10275 [Acidobacteriia bacterium]|nr:hypothetical protein [Terriglobia bacterium]
MKKAVVLLLVILFASVAWADDGTALLKFKTMIAVTGPFVGSVTPQTPIQGVNGAGLAWMISEAQGELKSNGDLEVRVRGLVLAAGANAGKNPLANFRAVLSCQSINSGNPTIVTVSTDNFPATMPEGDAEIRAHIDIPSPCFAPIVFVTTPGPGAPRWLAVTGQ